MRSRVRMAASSPLDDQSLANGSARSLLGWRSADVSTSGENTTELKTRGIDLGKNVFHVVGLDECAKHWVMEDTPVPTRHWRPPPPRRRRRARYDTACSSMRGSPSGWNPTST